MTCVIRNQTAELLLACFARPLFFTKQYILSSLDVFPIEFSEIKDNHILLYGEDVFNDIIIDPKNIRLFCEEQVKGKILLIYQSYIDSGGDERLLRKILHDSLNGLLPIFRQLLMIRNILPKTHKRELLEQFCQSFELNPDHIIPLYDDRYGSSVIAVSFVPKYLQISPYVTAKKYRRSFAESALLMKHLA